MIVITGGVGFIGSNLVAWLNRQGIDDILIVDDVLNQQRTVNLTHCTFKEIIDKKYFIEHVRNGNFPYSIRTLVHLGACSSTTERNIEYLRENNFLYTVSLAEWSIRNQIRFLYASSAATYGDGSLGFSDSDETTLGLKPINPYGESKHLFDLWMLRQGYADRIAGFKFFNVFGPNEYHKGDMVSGVYRAFHQIQKRGKVSLFQSDHPGYADGEQSRDFIYVQDCVDVIGWFLEHPQANGLFNVGTGEARTWNHLAHSVFQALSMPPQVEYVPLPEKLQGSYQYFTQAPIEKLRGVGYTRPFTSLQKAIENYVCNYLIQPDPYVGNVP